MNADIKPWQERCDWTSEEPATKLMVAAMKAENAELRAEVERLRAELAAGAACQGGGTSENGGLLGDAKTAKTRMGSSFEGGHLGSAPAAGTEKDAVIEAARRLVKAKGRYHTELNYKALAAALDEFGAHTKAGTEPAP